MDRSVLTSCMRSFVFLVIALLIAEQGTYGQSSTTGSIRGTVTDPQGAVISSAIVTVTSQGDEHETYR